jgi:AcrR family transcriptional regulator
MQPVSERKYHHGDLRRALIEAGLAILEEQGLDALSLRACAARAGVSHAAPKNHFDGLGGLLAAICAEGFRRHEAATRAALSGGGSREERLLRVLEAYVAFARAHPALYRMMFSMPGIDRSGPEFGAAARGSFAVLMEICDGLDWPGAGAAPMGANAWVMVWSFLHGYADLTLTGAIGIIAHVSGWQPELGAAWPGFGYAPAASREGPGSAGAG